MSTLHCTLENGADLYVNERQKIRHYRTRSTEERKRKKKEEECQITKKKFTRCVRKIALYSDVIHSFDWKSAIEHDRGVYKMRDSVPSATYSTLIMYCVYGASRSFLLIESTDSMGRLYDSYCETHTIKVHTCT